MSSLLFCGCHRTQIGATDVDIADQANPVLTSVYAKYTQGCLIMRILHANHTRVYDLRQPGYDIGFKT
ncbi:hypothetical protein I6F40_04650 [Pseudoalteromonas sp. SWXJ133]|uniref:hypothetical protein n=1 Tax=Pseudoalteromonas sp. SWXJ133 TaxID=2792069 RepID=UPI0018CC9F49|nr:hypothetical protein [Pseudoalteromonas sp. SWXJ133]MBH0019661.1 hypothetical protein [Pseudoalteromonas sp. SWXJ133]